MHHSFPTLLLLLAGCAILIGAGLHDIGFRTVPNGASLGLLAIGVALRAAEGGLAVAALIALAVLLVTYLFWRLGWMGGGDVKLLTAASMFVPPPLAPTLLVGTALAGGVLALVYLLAGRIVPPPPARRPASLFRRALRCELWRLHRRGPLPYAAAIATGGLLAAFAI